MRHLKLFEGYLDKYYFEIEDEEARTLVSLRPSDWEP